MSESAPQSAPPRSGRTGTWLLMVALLGPWVVYVATTDRSGPPPGWERDLHAAEQKARQEQRRMVIAFHMEGCPPCRVMEKTVLRSDIVRDALRSVVPVRVDVMEHKELANRLGVFATPTYAVLSSDGDLLARTQGYQEAEDFVRFIRRAEKQPDTPRGE